MLRHDRDGIATLVLNRSDRQNPLSMVMIGALSAQFKMIAGDSSVRKHLQVTPTSPGHLRSRHSIRRGMILASPQRENTWPLKLLPRQRSPFNPRS